MDRVHRESAEKELKSTGATDEERRQMQAILRRVHESDDGGAALAAELGIAMPTAAGNMNKNYSMTGLLIQPNNPKHRPPC